MKGAAGAPWHVVRQDDGTITVKQGDRSICDIVGTEPIDLAHAENIAAVPAVLVSLDDAAIALREVLASGLIDRATGLCRMVEVALESARTALPASARSGG
jgi:hypothetical protein